MLVVPSAHVTALTNEMWVVVKKKMQQSDSRSESVQSNLRTISCQVKTRDKHATGDIGNVQPESDAASWMSWPLIVYIGKRGQGACDHSVG